MNKKTQILIDRDHLMVRIKNELSRDPRTEWLYLLGAQKILKIIEEESIVEVKPDDK